MSLIEWKDEFSVGVAAVDIEHRDLIDMINDLHGLLGKTPAQEQVSVALNEIFTQISAHFALEEKFMRDIGYEDLREHKDEHEALLDELRDIMDRVHDDGQFDEERLSRELETWFTEHFRTQDAKLHRLHPDVHDH